MHTFCSRTELADFAGLSKSSLSRTLQKLSAKDYIRVISTRKYLHVDLLPAATALLPSSPPHKTILMRRALPDLARKSSSAMRK
ncbi:MAG: helix-turn-helix domain-containing protein [Roseburia hominis]